MQPLTTNEDGDSPHTRECRGELSRMARVRSNDTSLDDEHSTSPPQTTTIGAGLPLLQRLKLLKEKQEKDSVERNIHVVEVQVLNEKEPGVVDPGQHLLHRGHLVKQNEGTEREQRAIQTTASETAQVLASTVRTQFTSPFVLRPERSQEEGRSLRPDLRSPTLPSDSKNTGRVIKNLPGVSGKDISGEEGNNQGHFVVDDNQTSTPDEDINADQSNCSPSMNTITIPKTKELSEPSQPNLNIIPCYDQISSPLTLHTGTQSYFERPSSSGRLEPSDNGNSSSINSQEEKESIIFAQDLKDAQIHSISNDNNPNVSFRYVSNSDSLHIGVTSSEDETNYSREVRSLRERPLSLRFKDGTKVYKSIDDLSPECSDLPFVTRLKILNERQINSNYEDRTHLRSSSLDSIHNSKNKKINKIYDTKHLVRSNSESLLFEVILRNQQLRAQAKAAQHLKMEQTFQSPNRQLVSPESNETVERRKLKSILKKLSSTSLTASNSSTTPEVLTASSNSPTELRKLMRAQTVEGYAARHTKLSKSVTFNRDTLESPPHELTTNTQKPVFLYTKVHSSLDSAERENIVTQISELDPPHYSKESLVTNVNSESNTTSVSNNTKHYFAVETLDAATQTNLVNSLPIGMPHSSMFEYAEGNDFPPGGCQHCSAPETQRGSSEFAQRPQGNFVGRPQAKQKNFYRPGSVLLPTCAQEDEFFGGLLNGIKDIIKKHLVSDIFSFPSYFRISYF